MTGLHAAHAVCSCKLLHSAFISSSVKL